MTKEQNSNKSDIATKDSEFKISLSSDDIDKIAEKIRNGDNDVQEQNSRHLANGVILLNTCASCDAKFIPKDSMTCEKLCGSCVGKKQKEAG